MRVQSLEFQNATEACRQILREAAGHDDNDPAGFLTYGRLSELLQDAGYHVPPYEGVMPHLLGAVSLAEDHEGRGMLSALVVQSDSRVPGRGFFLLARQPPFTRSGDDDSLWLTEVRRVRADHRV